VHKPASWVGATILLPPSGSCYVLFFNCGFGSHRQWLKQKKNGVALTTNLTKVSCQLHLKESKIRSLC